MTCALSIYVSLYIYIHIYIYHGRHGEWPRYCRKVCWTKMVQNSPNDHFGHNDLIPNQILAFARPKWTQTVRFGSFRSANRTLAIPEYISVLPAECQRARSLSLSLSLSLVCPLQQAIFPRAYRHPPGNTSSGLPPQPYIEGISSQSTLPYYKRYGTENPGVPC